MLSMHSFSMSAFAMNVSLQVDSSVMSFSAIGLGNCSRSQNWLYSGSFRIIDSAWMINIVNTMAIAVDRIPFFHSTIDILSRGCV